MRLPRGDCVRNDRHRGREGDSTPWDSVRDASNRGTRHKHFKRLFRHPLHTMTTILSVSIQIHKQILLFLKTFASYKAESHRRDRIFNSYLQSIRECLSINLTIFCSTAAAHR